MIDQYASKRIYVIDPGEPPYLLEVPPQNFFVNAGSGLEIPFSNYVDPEGQYVYFKIKLRQAHKFATFYNDEKVIRIEKRTTTFDEHGGVYPITVELVEFIDNNYLPPHRYDFNLTIGKKLTPEEYLPKISIDD